MEEIWKDIQNYQGYQVSNKGRIRTYNKITYTKKHGERHWKNRILKLKESTAKNGRKDYRVELWKNGEHKTFLVARLVAFTFFEKDISNSELTVNHKDGNSKNNNIENLEIITLKENIQHGFRTGLYNSTKIVLTDKVTGTIIYPSSLTEADKLTKKKSGYYSAKIKKGIFEDIKYSWKLLQEVNQNVE